MKVNKIIPKISSFWQNPLYKFGSNLHHPNIDLLSPFLIRANVDSVYQVAAMNPALSFVN